MDLDPFSCFQQDNKSLIYPTTLTFRHKHYWLLIYTILLDITTVILVHKMINQFHH